MVSFGTNLIELQKECKPLLFDLPSVTGSGQWLAGSDADPHAPSNLDFHCIAIKYFLLVLQVVKALRSKDWSQSNLWWGKCLQWTIVGSIITYGVKRSDRSRIFLVGMYATISRRLTAFYSTRFTCTIEVGTTYFLFVSKVWVYVNMKSDHSTSSSIIDFTPKVIRI